MVVPQNAHFARSRFESQLSRVQVPSEDTRLGGTARCAAGCLLAPATSARNGLVLACHARYPRCCEREHC